MSGPAPEARPYEEITTSARTWPLREAGPKRNLTINLCAHPGKLTQILRRAVKKKTASMSVSGASIYYGKRCFVILVFSPWKAQDFSAALIMQQPALSLH